MAMRKREDGSGPCGRRHRRLAKGERPARAIARWHLLAANQRSDSIAVFRVDRATGGLTPVGEPYPLPSPVCLKMVRVAS